MYSGITKNYYRKTVGHLFTKPVQIEGTTQKFVSSKLSFIIVHIYAARRCECMWWENGRSGGEVVLCVGVSQVILWLLCNVHFVQSTQRAHLRDLTDLKAGIISTLKNINAPMLTRVCGKNLNIVSMCAVSRAVHTSNISSCQKKTCSVFLWLWTLPLR
jgi:hypothetical protein